MHDNNIYRSHFLVLIEWLVLDLIVVLHILQRIKPYNESSLQINHARQTNGSRNPSLTEDELMSWVLVHFVGMPLSATCLLEMWRQRYARCWRVLQMRFLSRSKQSKQRCKSGHRT